jgi:hypothetical protein
MHPIPDGLIANLIKVPRGRDFGIGKLGVLTPSERMVGYTDEGCCDERQARAPYESRRDPPEALRD